MKRRKFIANSIKAGLVSGATLGFGSMAFGKQYSGKTGSNYDLVAVRGGEPDAMFEKGIASLGGMKNFIRSGQEVVVKPNIGWDSVPEEAANTNPKLVGAIVRHCYEAGAKNVYVFDHTCNEWRQCYMHSGIEDAVKSENGIIKCGNVEDDYTDMDVPKGKILKKVQVHKLIKKADAIINVPVLKDHGSTKLTIAMKNLMGIVWDRKYWHSSGLNQCIADFATAVKPTLNVVDAYRVMKKHGPQGTSTDDVLTMKAQVISTDIVAADAAAAKFFGSDPAEIKYIKMADQMGIGTMNLESLNINRIKI